jgi:hypothetical protein
MVHGSIKVVAGWWVVGAGIVHRLLDRTNLSVAISSVAQDLGFTGEKFAIIGSWALTIFLVGYAIANMSRAAC